MEIKSPEFTNNGHIPRKFTCQGDDVNPGLTISNIPEGTKSLALVCDDPDAPGRTWVHWVMYDIPVTDIIEEDSSPGTEGMTSFGSTGYGGPCPPAGTHRYFFKVFALDSVLDAEEGIGKETLESKMEGHILGRAEIIGLYKKE